MTWSIWKCWKLLKRFDEVQFIRPPLQICSQSKMDFTMFPWTLWFHSIWFTINLKSMLTTTGIFPHLWFPLNCIGKVIFNFCLGARAFLFKVNSLQEPYAKYFAVHMLKLRILQTTWKNRYIKNIKMLDLLAKKRKLRVWCSFFLFFL